MKSNRWKFYTLMFFACNWLDCRNISIVAFIQCVKQMDKLVVEVTLTVSSTEKKQSHLSWILLQKRGHKNCYWLISIINFIDWWGWFISKIGHSRLRQMPLCIMKWRSSVLFLHRCLSVSLHANCMLNSVKVTFLFSNLVKECEMTYCMKKLYNLQ